MKRLILIVLLLFTLLAIGCVRELRHAPAAAASEAETFVRVLMIEQDAAAAFNMIDPAAAEGRSASDIELAAKQSGGYGDVTEIKATEFQPVPGQPAVDIFLTGRAGRKSYYYVIRMSGTMEVGYRPANLVVGDKPFPPADMRQALTSLP